MDAIRKFFLVIGLFLLFFVSTGFAAITCPSGCECISGADFTKKYDRNYNSSDFCTGLEYILCDDTAYNQYRYCFKTIMPPGPGSECGNHKCETNEDAELCPKDCLGSGEVYIAFDDPGDHNWYYDKDSNDIWNEMILLKLDVGSQENIKLRSMKLESSGTGDDSKDITRVEVYLDKNDNARVDAEDTLIGSAEPAYPADGWPNVIVLNDPVIQKEKIVSILIVYIMSPDAPVGSTYYFTLKDVNATGINSYFNISFEGLPLNSGTKTVVAPPSEPAKCNGILALSLEPNIAFANESITAYISELYNCTGKIASIYSEQCAIASEDSFQCSCQIGSGCSCDFIAPSQPGDYIYYACVDIDDDSIFDSGEDAVDDLKIKEKEAPKPPEPECITDAKCADDEKCSVSGKCEKVSGTCGYATNHKWNKYECGDELDCALCAKNEQCEENKCVEITLVIPEKTTVGDTVNVTVFIGDTPAKNEKIEVTDPNGNSVTVITDENGRAEFTPVYAGKYDVSSLGAEKTTNAQDKPFEISDIIKKLALYLSENAAAAGGICLLGVGLLALGIWLLMRQRSGERIKKPVA